MPTIMITRIIIRDDIWGLNGKSLFQKCGKQKDINTLIRLPLSPRKIRV